MKQRRIGVIMNGVTGRMGTNQHLVRSILEIRKQGGVGTNPFTTHGNIAVDIIKGAFSGNNALQASDFQSAPGKANAGVIKNLPDVNNWFTSILAKTAYPFINPTGVTQFRLRFALDDNDDMGADYLKFFSGNSTEANWPKLIVTYYLP